MRNRNLTMHSLRAWMHVSIPTPVLYCRTERLASDAEPSGSGRHATTPRRAWRPCVAPHHAGSVNWRTGGLSDPIDLTSSSDPVWVIECDTGSALLTNEIEAPRLEHDFRVSALGWEVLSVPWFDDEARLTRASEYANVAPLALVERHRGHRSQRERCPDEGAPRLSDAERDDLRRPGTPRGYRPGCGYGRVASRRHPDFEVAAAISATSGS